MNSNTQNEAKVVAAILTLAKASSQPSASTDDILSDYEEFQAKLRPQPASIPLVPDTTGRKFRDE